MTNLNTETIPFALPSIGREEEDAVLRVLRSDWLTTGKETRAFEQEFADYLGVKDALAVNSATAGLHLVLDALQLKQGDKVLVPSFTFTATAEVIRYCGADPVFVDLAPGSFNMDPGDCEEKILALRKEGACVRAMIPVHIAGDPEYLKEHWELSRKYGLFLLEDAAHCFPVESEQGMIGSWTDASVFSFYANKTITTGEGGMIVIHNEEMKQRISRMRIHGIDRAVWDRYSSAKAPWEYDVVAPGFKYNMTDIAAAMGRVQLEKAQGFLLKRKEIVKFYLKNLENAYFLTLPKWKENHAWHLFIIKLNLSRLKITRNEFIQALKDEGIGSSVHYKPLHMMTYYKERYALKEEDLPITSQLYQEVLSLPLFPDMTMEQMQRVCRVVLACGEENLLERNSDG